MSENRISEYWDSPLERPLQQLLLAIDSFHGPNGTTSNVRRVRDAMHDLVGKCAMLDLPEARQLESLLRPIEHQRDWSREILATVHQEVQFIVPPSRSEVV